MVAYCCTNNANRSRVSLRSTFSNCHVLIHCTRVVAVGSTIAQPACNAVPVIYRLPHNQPIHVNWTCNWDQPTSTTTNVVNDTAYSFASAPSWTRTTVANGHKLSAVRCLSRRLLNWSKNAIFTHLTCIWRPCWGDPIRIL